LTGWRIDIKSESTFALEESAAEFGGTGHGELQRCAALLRNGKRCVNAAVPGTRYCSLPAHARLAEMEAEGIVIAADQAVGIAGAGDPAKTPAAADTPNEAVPEAADVPAVGGDVPTEDIAPSAEVTAPAAAPEADDTASDDAEAMATIKEAVEATIEGSTSPDEEEQQ
jgi:transcription termination/antitermination protein NusA